MRQGKASSLFGNSAILLVLNLIGSGLNYLFQMLAGRFLTVDSFGTLNAIFAVIPILMVPGMAMHTMLTKQTARLNTLGQVDGINEYYTKTCVWYGLFVLVVALVGFLALPAIRTVLGVVSFSMLLVSLLLVVSSYCVYIFQGVMAGVHLFVFLGIYGLVVPLAKVISVLCAHLSSSTPYMQINIILLCTTIGTGLSLLYGWRVISSRKIRLQRPLRRFLHGGQRLPAEFGHLFAINLGLMALMNCDVISLRLLFGAETAGLYSSVQLFGRVVYFVATALATVMFPMVVSSQTAKEDPFVHGKKALLGVLAISVLLFVPLNLFGQEILHLFFGAKYDLAIPFVPFVCLISLGLSLNTITVNLAAALEKTKMVAVIVLVGCALIVGGCLLGAKTPQTVLLIIGVLSLSIFVVTYLYILRLKKNTIKEAS